MTARKIGVPREVIRWFNSILQGAPPAAPGAGPAADLTAERPRVAYSVKGKVARSQLTPRAIQVLDFLRDHPRASAHDVEKFLVAKAHVPIDSAPNAFRGAMARLRAVKAVKAEPVAAGEPMPAPKRKARKH